MHRTASIRRFLFVVAALVFSFQAAHAQNADGSWIPKGMEALAQHATFHTDFTFDRSMLALANNFIGDEETRHAVAKLNGISVHTYRFSAPGLYDPAALEAVRRQYSELGWKHVVDAQGSHAPSGPSPNNGPMYGSTYGPGYDAPDPLEHGRTDVFIRFDGMNVAGAVILLANAQNINVIAINGMLSPLDLLHLRGHFGIPRFQADNGFGQPHN